MEAAERCGGGARRLGFHHLRRDAARDNRDSTKGPGGLRSNAGAAVFRSHSDYTPQNALLLKLPFSLANAVSSALNYRGAFSALRSGL